MADGMSIVTNSVETDSEMISEVDKTLFNSTDVELSNEIKHIITLLKTAAIHYISEVEGLNEKIE